MRAILRAALVLAVALPCTAAAGASVPYYFDPNVCKGWYCYEMSEPEPEPKEPDEPVKPVPIGQVNWEATWTMPPEKLRKLINAALSYAQQDPRDEARMVTYLKLQGVAMRRAKAFQEAWADTLLKYPVLDATVERAPTLAASTAEIIAEKEDRATAIQAMRENMGILYFYAPSCRYCQQQQAILRGFAEKWGWRNITSIDVVQSPDIAAQYGVQTVPDLWVAGNVQGQTLQRRLHAGLTEHADLERGLLQAWSVWSGQTRYERPVMVHRLEPFRDFLNKNK